VSVRLEFVALAPARRVIHNIEFRFPVLVIPALCLACAVVPTPPLGPAPAQPSGAVVSPTFALPIEPYRTHLTRSGYGDTPDTRATARRPWNRTDSRIEPVTWGIPQALALGYGAGAVELAAHTTWLAGGGALRIWGLRPAVGDFGFALVLDGQHGYWTPDWRLGAMAEVHRRWRGASGWLGLGASNGTRRHQLDPPDSVLYDPNRFEGSIADFAPIDLYVLRSETRLEGTIGASVDAGPVHFALVLAPYGVLEAGPLQHTDLVYDLGAIHVDSFSCPFGVLLELVLRIELFGPPQGR
jgi:hypothetical protein